MVGAGLWRFLGVFFPVFCLFLSQGYSGVICTLEKHILKLWEHCRNGLFAMNHCKALHLGNGVMQ